MEAIVEMRIAVPMMIEISHFFGHLHWKLLLSPCPIFKVLHKIYTQRHLWYLLEQDI